MRVFVTGATGGIGSAVVPELTGAGHQVLALARSDASAQAAQSMGADVLRGDLDDTDSLRRGAAESDAVIHLAFLHFDDFAKAVTQESGAVEAFGAALEGTGKPFVMASGTPVVPGRASTEEDPMPTDGPIGGRGRNARAALDLADKGVRSAVVRLPRSVHRAAGPCGFASLLIETARRTGVSGYVGDGSQRWPAVHVLDAARLFRLVLEEATAGTVAHAVADEGDPMRALAETIGRELNVPPAPVPADHFGFLGAVFEADQPASSELTRRRFGWRPTHPSLLEDLAAGGYPA
ncbi:3-beta hydroxysteroid dehydrogenase [Mycobacterium sp. 852002-51613_SCH5001154]|uniref:SDR family oxidoreductase n=1 Tax=Mycobacterium sp. 852002-51613_SCH5001154 TaxID=1834104 RepID=UPI0008012115|nr:SDR family oxidoreductase [Mycobacterium sp. 852002-51613_SCH5001154]OBF73600.1 3-beta hydroxysteroid dehydrogenase [Mycobacterium sp. 852002-51613_SCH5001154]